MKKDFSDKTKEECNEAALARIYRSLAASEQSSQKLRRKMESEGYPPDSIEYALNRATAIGALDDERYCNMLVRSTLNQGKGMQRCLKEIEALGVDPMQLESYIEYLDNDDCSEIVRAMDFLERHPIKAKDVRGSAFRKLVSKGFSFEIASKASEEYSRSLRQNY